MQYGRGALRPFIKRRTAPGLELESAEITIGETRGVYEIRIAMRLTGLRWRVGAKPIVLDFGPCPFLVREVALYSGGQSVSDADIRFPRRGLVYLTPSGAAEGGEGALRIVATWQPTDRRGDVMPSVLSFPDCLPDIISHGDRSRGCTIVGRMEHGTAAQPPALHLCGVGLADREEFGRSNAFSQMVLVAGHRPYPRGDVRFFWEEEPDDRYEGFIVRMLSFFSEMTGVRPALRVAVVPHEAITETYWVPDGAVLTAGPRDLLGTGVPPWYANYRTSRLLGRAWWWYGLRVRGPDSLEIRWALADAGALMWVREVEGSAAAGSLLANHERMASYGAVRRHWWRVRGFGDLTVVASWTQRIYNALCTSAEAQDALRKLVKDHWGGEVDTRTIREQLEAVGV